MQVKINYKKLRKVNPEAARITVLEYLSSNGKNISDCSKVFGINRAVIYNIIQKGKEGDLKDRSRAPKTIPHKTPESIEELIIKVKKQTGLPAKSLSFFLYKEYGVDISYGTLRHVLRRNLASFV